MAAGVPALVTPGVNLAPAIEAAQAGWVAAQDVEKLSQQLSVLMSHPERLVERGRRARAMAEEFRWTGVARQLETAYRRLAGATSAR
jgi:glycosyltransferase involved in cell wall biosynthesis